MKSTGTPTRGDEMTLWGHLEALRGVLLRIVVAVLLLAVVAFVFMSDIYERVILWPCSPEFPTYRLLDHMAVLGALGPEVTGVQGQITLINTELASQFILHLSTSAYLALVLAFPYIIYQLWSFVSPGLLPHEKRGAKRAFFWSNLMFFMGVATAYFVVFPLTLRFLADYRLSESIANTITIGSYMDNFLVLLLLMGLMFELPLLAWLLGKAGVLTRVFFQRYRRHAIVALLVLAAIITPTGDPFTLMVVFLPIYLLWEGSAWLVPTGSVTPDDSE